MAEIPELDLAAVTLIVELHCRTIRNGITLARTWYRYLQLGSPSAAVVATAVINTSEVIVEWQIEKECFIYFLEILCSACLRYVLVTRKGY